METNNEVAEEVVKEAVKEVEQKKTSRQWKKQEKPGRNLPCPCGSGAKYKKCCLLNERTQHEKQMRIHEEMMGSEKIRKILGQE